MRTAGVASGNLTYSYGKTSFLIAKSSNGSFWHSSAIVNLSLLGSIPVITDDCFKHPCDEKTNVLRLLISSSGACLKLGSIYKPSVYTYICIYIYIYHLANYHSHGKSPFLIGKPSINGPFSIAMLNKQRVSLIWGVP